MKCLLVFPKNDDVCVSGIVAEVKLMIELPHRCRNVITTCQGWKQQ